MTWTNVALDQQETEESRKSVHKKKWSNTAHMTIRQYQLNTTQRQIAACARLKKAIKMVKKTSCPSHMTFRR